MSTGLTEQIPRVGMFATVRDRRGVVSAVEPYGSDGGRFHGLHVEHRPHPHRLKQELRRAAAGVCHHGTAKRNPQRQSALLLSLEDNYGSFEIPFWTKR
jgi:hypothetical protein